ncbi:MAG: T9SS type A sorting domain-containing protein [Bacteroidetes bacterium]|nr:T9SS type A sorting domain-containing protein [Bacteroidota bacterium]
MYFNRVPVTITAQAAYGYKFDHWKETGITDATIFVDSANDTMFTAVFKKDESIVSTGVIMYPNPSSVGLVSFEKLHRVSVFNAVGQKVLPEQTVRELNISNLSAGVYFVRFETGDEKRLVIVK